MLISILAGALGTALFAVLAFYYRSELNDTRRVLDNTNNSLLKEKDTVLSLNDTLQRKNREIKSLEEKLEADEQLLLQLGENNPGFARNRLKQLFTPKSDPT